MATPDFEGWDRGAKGRSITSAAKLRKADRVNRPKPQQTWRDRLSHLSLASQGCLRASEINGQDSCETTARFPGLLQTNVVGGCWHRPEPWEVRTGASCNASQRAMAHSLTSALFLLCGVGLS